MSVRAIQVALGLEVAWALFLAYEIHRHTCRAGSFSS